MKAPTKKKKKKVIKPTEVIPVVKRNVRVTIEVPYVYFQVARRFMQQPLRNYSGSFRQSDYGTQMDVISRVAEAIPDDITLNIENGNSHHDDLLFPIAMEVLRQEVLEAFRKRNPLPEEETESEP